MKTDARISTPAPGPQCAAFAPLLPALSDTLESDKQIALQTHLETCAHCRAQVAAYARLDDALRLHLGPAATPRLTTAQILQGIAAEEQPTLPQEAASHRMQEAPAREERVPGPPVPFMPASRRFSARLTALAALVLITLLVGSLSIGLVLVRQHNPPAQAPTHDNIYLTNNAGEVYKLDGRSHALLWKQQIPGQNLETPLTVVNGIAYGISLGGFVYALKATDGSVLWESVPVEFDTANIPAPLVAGGAVYFMAPQQSTVYALNALTGKVLWNIAISAQNEGSSGWLTALALADGVLYGVANSGSTAPGTLFALRSADGTLLWQQSLPGGSKGFSAPTLADGTLYLEAALLNEDYSEGSLYAFDALGGAERWHTLFTLGSLSIMQVGPVVSNGVVYLDYFSGEVYAFNAKDGAKLWSHAPIHAAILSTGPQVVGQTLYLVGKDLADKDFAVALDARSGAVLWTYRALFISQSFAVKNNIFYLSLDTGWVYALQASSGKELWHTRYIQHFSFETTQITIAP